jgi:hypothetical protein
LGGLDLLYAAHKIAAGWTPAVVVAAKSHPSPTPR